MLLTDFKIIYLTLCIYHPLGDYCISKNELRGLLDESKALETTTKRLKDAAKELVQSAEDEIFLFF